MLETVASVLLVVAVLTVVGALLYSLAIAGWNLGPGNNIRTLAGMTCPACGTSIGQVLAERAADGLGEVTDPALLNSGGYPWNATCEYWFLRCHRCRARLVFHMPTHALRLAVGAEEEASANAARPPVQE